MSDKLLGDGKHNSLRITSVRSVFNDVLVSILHCVNIRRVYAKV